MEKFVQQNIEGFSILNEFTGEIKKLTLNRKVTVDEFILMFLRSIPELIELDGKPLKLLLICLKKCSLNPVNTDEGNAICVNKVFKNTVREYGLDITDAAIDVYISRLAKLGFLIRQCRGYYLLNPKYFFKGRITDATKVSMKISNT